MDDKHIYQTPQRPKMTASSLLLRTISRISHKAIEGPRRISKEEADLERQNLIRQTEESRRSSHSSSKRTSTHSKGGIFSQYPPKRQSTGTPEIQVRESATRATIIPESVVPYPKQLSFSPTPIPPPISYTTVYV